VFVKEQWEDEVVEVFAGASEFTESSVVEFIEDLEQQFVRKIREGSNQIGARAIRWLRRGAMNGIAFRKQFHGNRVKVWIWRTEEGMERNAV
jgi:hypothetical protein